MPTAALATTTAPRTYAELRRRVEDTLLMGQRLHGLSAIHRRRSHGGQKGAGKIAERAGNWLE